MTRLLVSSITKRYFAVKPKFVRSHNLHLQAFDQNSFIQAGLVALGYLPNGTSTGYGCMHYLFVGLISAVVCHDLRALILS